ncbi:hypothetical protein [Paenibacillus sp. Soil522]|uniref:hypothetical protein n=1 Tax=Paenibacillus sp. Soil522 TaxID=1736388 RepID=UPI0006FEB575|nr:hypothetical protein [Paenibacillus sp. Soil522]KRE43272.1 hypothetical protein ASG81_15985 [Paenibacillus sp. Soil522]
MAKDSLRAKQEKLQLESNKTNNANINSHTEEEKPLENRQNDGANPEWRRFYEVIKEITGDMRY